MADTVKVEVIGPGGDVVDTVELHPGRTQSLLYPAVRLTELADGDEDQAVTGGRKGKG